MSYQTSPSVQTNQDHKENQDHLDISVSTPSTSRSTPAQDKVAAEIDQMTKKIEAHKASLESGITENRTKALEIVKSITQEREKALKRKLLLQKEAERKKTARLVKKKKSRGADAEKA